MKKGKLVVIEGIDGSGKQSVVNDLVKKIGKAKVKTIAFPRYERFFGKLIKFYLNGRFGKVEKVSPYLSMWLYAFDRLGARAKIKRWLEAGYLVITDRYVSSSLAHQASRLPINKQQSFIDWVLKVEYGCHRLPKEDWVILIDIPAKKAQKFVKGREIDKAEADLSHQKKAEKMYHELVKKFNHYVMIESFKNKRLMPIEEIADQVLKVLKRRKVI